MIYQIRNNDNKYVLDIRSSFLESTYNLAQDIDYIYDLVFKNFIIMLKHQEILPIGKISISSSKLNSEDAKKSHEVNPVRIDCGHFKGKPGYFPFEHVIRLPSDVSALTVLLDYSFDYKQIQKMTKNDREWTRFQNAITEQAVKMMIYHELSHWVDDSFHNHIKDILGKDLDQTDFKLLKQKNVNMTHFEINAQIHGIKQLKREYSQTQWDTLSFSDVLDTYASLNYIAELLNHDYGNEVMLIWAKNLISRMNREGFLGRNMKLKDLITYFNESIYWSRRQV